MKSSLCVDLFYSIVYANRRASGLINVLAKEKADFVQLGTDARRNVDHVSTDQKGKIQAHHEYNKQTRKQRK